MNRTIVLLLALFSAVSSEAAQRLILHVDMKAGMMRREKLIDHLRAAARDGYNAVLWEVEDKVRFDTCPEVAYKEAYSKAAFREILAEAEKLGLEPIPLLQTFGHAEYVLAHAKYAPLREKKDDPTCYCVLNPKVRPFLAALLKEYLDLFGPSVKAFHLGGDEARVFGTCPACAARKKGELYAEHLAFLSSILKARGVKPGIWSDMVLSSLGEGAEALVPSEYTMWQWDYAIGNGKSTAKWTPKVDLLKKRGYDIIYCGASQCGGDDPFLVRYDFHANNLAALAETVRAGGACGFCVTSWSVRGCPKVLQRPLYAFAAKRFLAPSPDASADLRAALSKFFGEGAPLETLVKATDCCWQLYVFDLRDCLRHFDPGHPIGTAGRGNPKADVVSMAQTYAKPVKEALAELKKLPQETTTPAFELFLKGLELKAGYYEACGRWNGPGTVAPPPIASAAVYYGEEETSASAEISAHAALDLLAARIPNEPVSKPREGRACRVRALTVTDATSASLPFQAKGFATVSNVNQ